MQSIVNQNRIAVSNTAYIVKKIGKKFEMTPQALIEDFNIHQLRPTSSKYSLALNNRFIHADFNINFNLAPGVNTRTNMLIKKLKRKVQNPQIPAT